MIKWKKKNNSGYYHFIHVYHKWKSYDVCFLRYEAWQSFLPFWAIFCPFTPLTTQKNQHFEKMKQQPGDIIILNKSTKNYDHMLYRSWDMTHDGCNFHFLFWAAFCPFKAPADIIILPTCTKNQDQIMYGSWDISATDRLMDGQRSDI